jgi:hypothetical protein
VVGIDVASTAVPVGELGDHLGPHDGVLVLQEVDDGLSGALDPLLDRRHRAVSADPPLRT